MTPAADPVATAQTAPLPRREQNKQAKLERIIAATRELLAEQGYEAMLIREIAARADVAVGTVFLYAATKAELLLMVLALDHQVALDEGIAASRRASSPRDAALALVSPVLAWGLRGGRTTLAYQREVLFGEASERYRPDSLAISLRVERELRRLLTRSGVADAPLTARVLFNSLQVELSRAILSGADLPALLVEAKRHITLVLGEAAPAPSVPAGARGRPGARIR